MSFVFFSTSEIKLESISQKYEEKLKALTHDCLEANAQVESLHQLTSDQNDQLVALKKQTEAAIRAKEVANQEVILISLANLNARTVCNKALCL